MDKQRPSKKFTDLRREAEKSLQFETVPVHQMSEADIAALIHELRVHEIELEMQNEQLRQNQIELEQSRSKYTDLFDFAPIGYFVFDEKGCIAEANLTGPSMLNRNRRDLIGKPFNLFVAPQDRDAFRGHRRAVMATNRTCDCVVRFLLQDGRERIVQLRSRSMAEVSNGEEVVCCRTAALDITARQQAEQALRKARDELEARVAERTAQLRQTVHVLQQEMTVRKQQEQEILENHRQLAELNEELLLTEERERRRIANALHDSIGQSLAFAKRELGLLRKDLPEVLGERFDRAKQQIDAAVWETRSLTFELSPSTLYTFGLEAAVEELSEQLSRQEGFACHLQAQDGAKPLSDQNKVLLYRAARELLLNVAKHAAAKNVVIRIEHIDNNICVEVEDDGKGFDVSSLKPQKGKLSTYGLFSLRQRLDHLNGSFEIRSTPGHGTKVTIQAPLQTDHQNDSKE